MPWKHFRGFLPALSVHRHRVRWKILCLHKIFVLLFSSIVISWWWKINKLIMFGPAFFPSVRLLSTFILFVQVHSFQSNSLFVLCSKNLCNFPSSSFYQTIVLVLLVGDNYDDFLSVRPHTKWNLFLAEQIWCRENVDECHNYSNFWAPREFMKSYQIFMHNG